MSDPSRSRSAHWWRGAVGYQIYLRSFQDSDGDGLGDLGGVRRRLGYLRDLGVDLIWLTPHYPSPDYDHGYDVADYRAVDPRYGTLDDLEGLVADAHDIGLKVVADLVPNHTSSHHRWFREAIADPSSPYRSYYVWRDPAPDGSPPNNWVSHFGGPAWTLDEASGQYYLHLFLPEQPDLNWAEPAVADEFDAILRFWFERGIDGFRIDVAHSLVVDQDFRDNPLIGAPPDPDAHPRDVHGAYDHRYDLDQPGVVDVYRRWNRVAAEYDAILIGEVYLLEPELLTRYVEDGTGLHTAFCFPALHAPWDAKTIRRTLERSVAAGAGALSWPLSSHDDPRAAERFGGGEVGARRALAYFTLLASLPGIPFLYMGDELGLDNGSLSARNAQDPVATRNEGQEGRDGSRTPLVWEPGDGFGFTTGEPWLPFGDNRRPEHTAAAQVEDPRSHLNRVRLLLQTRRDLPALTGDAAVTWLDTHPVVAIQRDDVVVACNCGDGAADVPLPGPGTVRFASDDGATVDGERLRLPADTAAIVQLEG